jgi:thiol-disulfide isomerase/thioredoxin
MKSNAVDFSGIIDCTLYQTQENEFGRKLESFVDEISRSSPGKFTVSRNSDISDLPAFPCFRISSCGYPGIVYAALPAGHQFPPFLKALELIAGGNAPVSNPESASASIPAEIQVLISENCPHCPKTVEAAILLASRHPWISPYIIDAGQFPDIAEKYGIKSVPATILDRRLVLVGNSTADRLMDLIKIRGTQEFEMEVVLSLIESRRISEAAECLLHDAGRQVILALVQDVDFAKRLSALVVIEKALDVHPEAVRAMAPSFAALLSNRDARIRGDVADLLGKIGDARTIAQLEPLTADPDPDVAEAAIEAIEELRKHCNA